MEIIYIVQEFLKLQQAIIELLHTSSFWVGACIFATFVVVTRSQEDTRYLMESTQLTCGWWDGSAHDSARPMWRTQHVDDPPVQTSEDQKREEPRSKVGVNQMRDRAA